MRRLFSMLCLAGLLPGLAAAAAPLPSLICDLRFSSGLVLPGVPVASTAAQQERGLSQRDSAGPGLLFTWPAAARRVFWMHDTRMPLTVGFFDAAGRLFDIEDMAPLSDVYHLSPGPASAALELAQGQFQAHRLAVGVRLVGRSCRPAP